MMMQAYGWLQNSLSLSLSLQITYFDQGTNIVKLMNFNLVIQLNFQLTAKFSRHN